jgi:hypothetical protein
MPSRAPGSSTTGAKGDGPEQRLEPTRRERCTHTLGILPSVAYAKPEDGEARQLTFSASSEHLYVFGSGVRLIDLQASR